MSDTVVTTSSTVTNQLPPRTNQSHRWPRKWATLGGRGAPSTSIPPLDQFESNGKSNGHHRPSTSLFRKSSTISRTNGTTLNAQDLSNDSQSLKKSRSLINVLRSKLNSPAVLRRFRTKSRENGKQAVTEIHEEPTKVSPEEPTRKFRKRDPSPMRRLTQRIAQLTRSSTHTSITPSATAEPVHNQDQVDHINACYDEIRAKYFDTNNNTTTTSKSNTISLLTQHPCAPATERLKEMLSTTTTSSIDYYDRPNMSNGDLPNRSLSNISINGSLLSHELLNNSQPTVPSPPLQVRTPDDPQLVARKQSNIKLNCMLSGYGFGTPFGNHEKLFGQQHDLFKFHHYHDVGKRKFDWNNANDTNRFYSSMRTRPISRSIDSFRRATTTIETDLLPSELNEEKSEDLPSDNELVKGDDTERKTCTSKIHIQPAAALHVKAFVSSSSSPPAADSKDDEFERNFLRAVDRALGLGKQETNHLLQPIYDIPSKLDVDPVDDEQRVNGNESPSVELVDRTGEYLDQEQMHWQSSAVYDDQQNDIGSVIDDLTQKTEEVLMNELKVGTIND